MVYSSESKQNRCVECNAIIPDYASVCEDCYMKSIRPEKAEDLKGEEK